MTSLQYEYTFYTSIVFCLLAIIKLSPSFKTFVAVWWVGSIVYALVVNNITLPADANPWTFSIVATTFILLIPTLSRPSTRKDHSQSSNEVIGVCNALNIFAVILGNVLIGGCTTYYLKLAEPLVVILIEISIYGIKTLTFKHARNGSVSVFLLIIFHMTVRTFAQKKSKGNFLSLSLIIGSISILSVAIKVVLGAKRDNNKSSPGDG